MSKTLKKLTTEQSDKLLSTLQKRFEKHKERHPDIDWQDVLVKLKKTPDKLNSLYEMEQTGGEPDVVDQDKGEYIFFDCAQESPKGRRSICYDKEALEARKKFPPKDSAINMAEAMGIKILTEAEYRKLQKLGNFDTKTSSWIETPSEIRKLGGALFADFRYNSIFIYHNGADSYYAARGFRGSLRV